MKAKRLLKAVKSLEIEMEKAEFPYPARYRDEIQSILGEFLEDVFHYGGVLEIQQRVTEAQKIDLNSIQLILDTIQEAQPVNYILTFGNGTQREIDVQKELNELYETLSDIKKNEMKIGPTDILFRIEMFFDSHVLDLMMAFRSDHLVFGNIKKILGQNFSKISNDEILLLWARIKAQFKEEEMRSGFKYYEDIMGPDFWNDEDIASIREKVLDFIVRLKPMTIRRMVSDGLTLFPSGIPGIARIAVAMGSKLINSLDMLVIRSIAHIVSYFKYITFASPADLAKAIGQDPGGLIFCGVDYASFLKDLKEKNNNQNDSSLVAKLYQKMLRLIEYIEEVAVTKTSISEALWHYKLGQEVIAPQRTQEIIKGKINELALQKELSKFLIERGILSFGRTFGRNEIDLYSKEMTGEEFVIETKIYKSPPSETEIISNLVQLQSYMDQISQPRGVLAIYNCSDDLIISPKRWHKGRYWILVINIGTATPSKRGRSIEIRESADVNKLIYCVVSGNSKKKKSKRNKVKKSSKAVKKGRRSKLVLKGRK